MPSTYAPENKARLFDALLFWNFLAFLEMVFLELRGGAFKPNWHLEAIAYQLRRVAEGKTRDLVITMPPRSLKSMTISVAWVAWRLAHDPRLKFICVSYSSELAGDLARQCRQVMTSAWYQRICDTRLRRETDYDLVTTKGGGRFATSVGGTLTGKGGDVIIIDDPIKPADATSEAGRRHVLEWANNTLPSRLDDKQKGALILVMQRLHEDDLAGHLLAAGHCVHLNLPAIAAADEVVPVGGGRVHRRREGDVLHPLHEPLHVLERLKRQMGSASFAAQYQQAPVPAEGAMIKRAWLQRYEGLLERRDGDKIIQSWDCASKTGLLNDYSVCVTAILRRRKLHVVDVYRGRLEFPELRAKAISHALAFKADTVLIEDTAAGAQLIQELHRSAPQGVRLPIAIKALADKVSRVFGITSMLEAGEVLFPHEAPWLADFEHELIGFPNARHDDQVDALAQLLNWFKDNPSLPSLVPPSSEGENYWAGAGSSDWRGTRPPFFPQLA